MFGFGKKKEYTSEIVARVVGDADGVYAEMQNYPIRVEVDSGKRVEFYPDFNVRFMESVWKQVGDFSLIADRLQAGLAVEIDVENAPRFTLHLRTKNALKKREFDVAFPEAISVALTNERIGR